MITRIQALNYRCLRYVDVTLDRFHVLVGPNASGKSTLFDVVSFMSDFVRDGLEKAISNRTYNFQDLVWGRPTEELSFELALEIAVPADLRGHVPTNQEFNTYRYEIAVGEVAENIQHIYDERGILISNQSPLAASQTPRRSFPGPSQPPKTILSGVRHDHSLVVLERGFGQLTFRAEDQIPARLKDEVPASTVLGQLPTDPLMSHLRLLDETRSPVSRYFYSLLSAGINSVFLDSGTMRAPSGFASGRNPLALRGARLPWTVKDVLENDRELYNAWMNHVQVEMEDLVGVRVVHRPEDRTHYLMLEYSTGVEIPSWMASDGTLRFLALMLAAYMADKDQVYLLDEPENGVHLSALDAIYDATSSAGASQILVATHSPAFLSKASPEDVICCAKDAEGATDVVRGDCHPIVHEWQGAVNMDVFFAKGVVE